MQYSRLAFLNLIYLNYRVKYRENPSKINKSMGTRNSESSFPPPEDLTLSNKGWNHCLKPYLFQPSGIAESDKYQPSILSEGTCTLFLLGDRRDLINLIFSTLLPQQDSQDWTLVVGKQDHRLDLSVKGTESRVLPKTLNIRLSQRIFSQLCSSSRIPVFWVPALSCLVNQDAAWSPQDTGSKVLPKY